MDKLVLNPIKLSESNKNKLLVILFLSLGFIVVCIVWKSVSSSYPIIFPMEDSYLYHTYGHFLSQGKFFTYSIDEPYSNGNTSFLYYILVGFVHSIASVVGSIFKYDVKELSLSLTFILHAILYEICILLFIKLLLKNSKINLILLLLTFNLFFNGTMIYGFFCGLENPITILILIVLLIGIERKRKSLEFFALSMLPLTRPEGLIVTAIYATIRYGIEAYERKNIRVVINYILPLFLICCIVPLLNFYFTGQFTTSSAARISYHPGDGQIWYTLKWLFSKLMMPWDEHNSIMTLITTFIPWINFTEIDNPKHILSIYLLFICSIIYFFTLIIVVFRVSFSKRWVMGIINMIMFISLIYFISHKSNYPVVLGRYSTAAFAAIIISTLSFFISILVFIYFNNIVSYLNTKLKKTMGLIKIGNLLLFLIIWSIVSLILAGSGEFNRYTIILFPFVVFLIAKYSINYSKKLVVLLLLMTIIPTIYSSLLMFDHFRRSTTFLSKLHFPTALEIKNSKGINSVAVWETGIISYFLSNEKKIIDIYGLGTTRYAILNHGFRLDKLKQFLNDKPDALVSWSSSLTPEPGLDENNGISIKKHFTVSLDSQIYYMKNNYPQKMSTYLLTYR